MTRRRAPWTAAAAARAAAGVSAPLYPKRQSRAARRRTHQRRPYRRRRRRGRGGELVVHVHGAHEGFDGCGVPAQRRAEPRVNACLRYPCAAAAARAGDALRVGQLAVEGGHVARVRHLRGGA